MNGHRQYLHSVRDAAELATRGGWVVDPQVKNRVTLAADRAQTIALTAASEQGQRDAMHMVRANPDFVRSLVVRLMDAEDALERVERLASDPLPLGSHAVVLLSDLTNALSIVRPWETLVEEDA